MEKITVENFEDSLVKSILDKLLVSTIKEHVLLMNHEEHLEKNKRFFGYHQALVEIYDNDILEKASSEEISILYNYLISKDYENDYGATAELAGYTKHKMEAKLVYESFKKQNDVSKSK